jgi:major membrane immunogen (membrane-anchored lipoprotein)
MRRLAAPVLASVVLLAGCSSRSASQTGSSDTNYAAQMASTDLYAKAPQHIEIGITASTQGGIQLLTSGTIDLSLSPFQGGPGTPVSGSARYLATPGTEADTGTAHLSDPSTARGIYELDGTFDQPGVWQADVTFSIDGGPVSLSTQFQVAAEPELPAPGQKAFRTDNLTMRSDADPASIDSQAQDGAPIPDPGLHQDTIAGAIAAHRAVVVLFATPVYCQSQFCGPETDELVRMAQSGPKSADYIHIEIYKDFQKNQVNVAAKQWVIRPNAASDPWLFVIGSDGIIKDRWGPLFDPTQVMSELRQVAG